MKRLALVLVTTSLLGACGHNDDDEPVVVNPPPAPEPPVMLQYEVRIVNMTAAQPLSPIAVVLGDDTPLWQIGEAASDALVTLAEGGDNTDLLAQGGFSATATSEGPLPPGEQISVSISIEEGDPDWLSIASMLVNTNDAFTGLTAVSLSEMEVGETHELRSHIYDAGSEENTETAGSIPGPADGGEGVSDGREAANRVSLHAGVVSQDDGLPDSVLTLIHRFDQPAVKISVTRVE